MSDEVKSESTKKNEDWMNSKWRPAMGWMYMLVCISDFVLFPVLWSLVQVVGDGKVETQWSPITLQGAGLFHMAMGAILGIAAYGRTQEKLNGANNGGIQTPTTGSPSGTPTFGQPSTGSFNSAGSFNSPVPSSTSGGGFGSTYTAPATNWGTTPIATASGKKVVPQEEQPSI
jgi:hypothetical protein